MFRLRFKLRGTKASVTYFYAFAQNEASAAQGIIRGFFFYPKNFSRNILAILVEFSLEKN
jgi:hypothetical protein